MKGIKKTISFVLAAALLAIPVSGCSSSTKSTGESTSSAASSTVAPASSAASEASSEAAKPAGGKKFGYTYWAAADFFTTIGETMQETAAKNGDTVIIVDAQQDQAKQIGIIEDFITQGVSAVFLNPVDRDGIKPALEMLQKANIPIINIDTSVADIDMVNTYIASDNYNAGKVCAEDMIKRFPEGGDIAVLDYPANSAVLDRVKGFLDTIKDKNFKVVAQQDAEGKPEPGLAKTNDILQANPNIIAVFGGNDQCAMGALAAVTESKSKAVIYGVDGAPESKEAIAAGGAFVATGAQSPKKIGQASIDAAYKILNGETVEKNIAVETFLIDKNNVAQYLNGWQ